MSNTPNCTSHSDATDWQLRDRLAGQALAGILANPNHRIGEVTFDRVCTDAFKFADAMLAVRDGAITRGGE